MGNTKLPTWHHRYDSQAQTVVAQQFGLDEKALESALAAKRAAASKERDDLGLSPQAFARYVVAEAIRAYLTASDAERELVERLGKFAGRVRINNGSFSDIAHEAATALTDLEAENARLKAEVERLEKADETRAQDISRLAIERDAARDRLSEALKALDDAADALDRALEDVSHWGSYASEYFQDKHGLQIDLDRIKEQAATARRVREGGK